MPSLLNHISNSQTSMFVNKSIKEYNHSSSNLSSKLSSSKFILNSNRKISDSLKSKFQNNNSPFVISIDK